MNYQTFPPHSDLASIVKCYWTLEVPADKDVQRQLIIPDGCIEMIFTLGDDVKRFTSEDTFLIQPREMILGQITGPFYIQPTGYVSTFAVRFYPYGFSNFVSRPIKTLADKETAIASLFGEERAKKLARDIIDAETTSKRIEIVEAFILDMFTGTAVIDQIVKSTVDTIFSTNGTVPINAILDNSASRRRQLERKFVKQIGISPKQLGKVVRLQSVLKMMLNQQPERLTAVAYESDYYDQAHFIKDFKEFTDTTPGEFLGDEKMKLSSLFSKKD